MMNVISRQLVSAKPSRSATQRAPSTTQPKTPLSQSHSITTYPKQASLIRSITTSTPANAPFFFKCNTTITNIASQSANNSFLQKFFQTRSMSTVKDHIWSPRASDGQKELTYLIEELFPDVEIQIDYKNPEFVYNKSKRQMEFDIYIPQYNLIVEWFGREHYTFHWRYGPSEPQKQRDQEKRDVLKKAGITHIIIPHWWDGSKDSLIATIHKYRPDLIPDAGTGQPVPEQMPEKIQKRLTHNPVPPDPVPYHIMSCEQKGGFPMCRGCKRVFTDRSALRVVVEGSYNRKYGLQPATYSFCLDPGCIKKAIEEPNSLANIPPFDGKIHIPEVLLSRATNSPRCLE